MDGQKMYNALIEDLKPCLKQYLELRGVQFSKENQFHCFNGAAHQHNDKNASASIIPGGKGFKCFACGVSGDIFTACNLLEDKEITGKGFLETVKYLADVLGVPHDLDKKKKIQYEKECEYIYFDEDGLPAVKIVRMVNSLDKKDKQFYPYRFDKKNGMFLKKSGLGSNFKRHIYNLAAVRDAIETKEYIYFAEGEKCAETLKKLGLTGTCIQGGVNGWKKPHTIDYMAALTRAKVIILPDNDRPGKDFAKRVAMDLSSVTEEIKILELPDLKEKEDIADWASHGGTKEQLKNLALQAPVFKREESFQPAEKRERAVYVHDNCYWRRGRQEDKKISNFIIVPETQTQEDGQFYFTGQAITDTGRTFHIEFPSEVFSNKHLFRKHFQNIHLAYLGNDEDLQSIKLNLSENHTYEEKKGVSFIGIHKTENGNIFVGDDKAVDAKGQVDENTVLMPQYRLVSTSITDRAAIKKDEIEETIQNLFQLNSIDKTATILGFMSACYYKTHFMEAGLDFPNLLLFGEAGSGKTQTVERMIKPFFGISESFPADQITPFTSMRLCSSSNVFPFVIEEYKPRRLNDKIKNAISSILRNSYNNFSGVRGRADQKMNAYTLMNPIIMVGEEALIEPAIQERSLELSFAKTDLNPQNRESFQYIRDHKEQVAGLGRLILNSALKDDAAEIKNIYLEAEKEIYNRADFQSRIMNNICVAVAGLKILDKALVEMGLSLLGAIGKSIEELTGEIIRTVEENILDGGDSYSTIDAAIEIFDRMAIQEILTEETDYSIITNKNGEKELALDVRLVYDKFTRYVKEYNIQAEIITNHLAFTKQLRKTIYFGAYRKVRFKAPENPVLKNAYLLDMERLNKKIRDLQKFGLNIGIDVEENPFTGEFDNIIEMSERLMESDRMDLENVVE